MSRRLLLLTVLLAACADERPTAPAPEPVPSDDSTAPPDAPAAQRAAPDSGSAAATLRRAEDASRTTMAFERSAMVFDTTEPPPVPVVIQPRPPPPPEPAPRPAPRPPEPTPRPPEPAAASGSCDVQDTESFCFAYTGDGWSRQAAREHCDAAPDSRYRPATCPSENAVATCRFTRDGAPTLEIVYTYYAPYDLMLAELACPGDFERIENGG